MWLEGLAERAWPPAPPPRPPQPMRPNLTTSLPAARTPCGTINWEAAAMPAAAAVLLSTLRREGEAGWFFMVFLWNSKVALKVCWTFFIHVTGHVVFLMRTG